MLGAIIGDIAGSRFEHKNLQTKDFKLFTRTCQVTDDSITTLAVAKALMEAKKMHKGSKGERKLSIKDTELIEKMTVKYLQELGQKYPYAGYGGMFRRWLFSEEPKPYNSFGNGAAMRVSPVAYVGKTKEEVERLAEAVTAVTHNHEEGIKGAKAVATAIFMAREGFTKTEIRNEINNRFYALDFTIDEIKDSYGFSAACQEAVPQAITAFLESDSFENAIRRAIYLGGDSDTIAAIAGSIAEAYYSVPVVIKTKALTYLDDDLSRILQDWSLFMGEDDKIG